MAIQIGDKIEGGTVFYVDETGENGLIAALHSQNPANWSPTAIGFLIGANDELIGTGKINNDKITAHFGPGNYCAKICEDLVLDGFSGWYLPSKQELDLMLVYDYIIGTGSYYDRPSSTEADATHVKCVDFTPPQQNVDNVQLKRGYSIQGFVFTPIRTHGVLTPVDISTLDLPAKPVSEPTGSSNITVNSATVTAEFTAIGASPIITKGVVYNTVGNPFFGNSAFSVVSPNTDLGQEDFNLTGLIQGTTYYVRSFVRDDLGAHYGDQIQFVTAGDPIDILIITQNPTNLQGNSVTLNATDQLVYPNGVSVLELGFYLSTDITFATFTKELVANPNTFGHFQKDVSELLPFTQYYFKGYGLTQTTFGQKTQFGDAITFMTGEATAALKNPEAPLRTAYIAALTPIQVTYAKKVPKTGSVPKQYTVIGAQTKNPTDKGKEGCMEWLCTITVDVFNVNPSGYAGPGKNDDIEEKIIDTIEAGIVVEGFSVKSTDFIQSSDLSIETPTESIERRVIIYQHWLAQI